MRDLRIVGGQQADAAQHLFRLGHPAGTRQHAAQQPQRRQRIRRQFGRGFQRIDRLGSAAHALQQHAATELEGGVERVLLARDAQAGQFGFALLGVQGDVDAVQDVVQAVRPQTPGP